MAPNRLFRYVLDKLRQPSGGVQIDSSWVPAPVASGLGLLVYAEQNIAVPLTSYTLIPFETEIFDSQNSFSGGYFTPTASGLHRIGCDLYVGSTGALNFYTVQIWAGSQSIRSLFSTDSYVAYAINSYKATLPLTAGTAYHIRMRSDGTDSALKIAGDEKNTLTIERLS